jgi:hypothetical protein
MCGQNSGVTLEEFVQNMRHPRMSVSESGTIARHQNHSESNAVHFGNFQLQTKNQSGLLPTPRIQALEIWGKSVSQVESPISPAETFARAPVARCQSWRLQPQAHRAPNGSLESSPWQWQDRVLETHSLSLPPWSIFLPPSLSMSILM